MQRREKSSSYSDSREDGRGREKRRSRSKVGGKTVEQNSKGEITVKKKRSSCSNITSYQLLMLQIYNLLAAAIFYIIC